MSGRMKSQRLILTIDTHYPLRAWRRGETVELSDDHGRLIACGFVEQIQAIKPKPKTGKVKRK